MLHWPGGAGGGGQGGAGRGDRGGGHGGDDHAAALHQGQPRPGPPHQDLGRDQAVRLHAVAGQQMVSRTHAQNIFKLLYKYFSPL